MCFSRNASAVRFVPPYLGTGFRFERPAAKGLHVGRYLGGYIGEMQEQQHAAHMLQACGLGSSHLRDQFSRQLPGDSTRLPCSAGPAGRQNNFQDVHSCAEPFGKLNSILASAQSFGISSGEVGYAYFVEAPLAAAATHPPLQHHTARYQ